MKIIHSIKRLCVFVALLLSAANLANAASSLVTFNVDMSEQIILGNFNPATDHVSARGAFNGWGELVLTNNPLALNPSLYSGVADDTTTSNGGVEAYKFYNSRNGQWDDGAVNNSGKNRAARLPSASGASVALPTVFFGDVGPQVTNQITFRVDMAQQINIGAFVPGTHTPSARGTFNGWSASFPLTNDPSVLTTNAQGVVTSNVYVGTFDVASGTNSSLQFKYAFDPGGTWEDPATINKVEGNRFFVNTGSQALPILDFNDAPYAPIATNIVTFQVDMTAQILTGTFNPGAGNTVDVRGSMNGWSGSNPLTNNPAGANTNLYSTDITIVNSLNAQVAYKFTYSNPGVNWESSSPKLTTPDSGPNDYNRIYFLQNGATILPPVFFDDKLPNDYLPVDTLVTFTVDMNGAIGTDAHAFNAAAGDTVWINGEFVPWYAWWNGVNPTPAPAQFQMIENPPGSGIYSNQVLVAKGTRVAFAYKYGMGFDGALGPNDDEAPGGQDHYRVVRSTASGSYTMPLDKFGTQYREPFFSAGAKGDGRLTIAPATPGTVSVSWLGRPGAYLQSSASVTGPWTDHLNTDGTTWTSGIASTNGLISVTSWPAIDKTFYRLVKP